MDINLTKDELHIILRGLSTCVEKLSYDLDGGWIDNEDDIEEAKTTITESNAMWDKLYLVYRKACEE